MNKKFLSAILFGTLMVSSTGTFVSCKDYDDDIDNLQGQITANADAIKALQDLVGSGKYVTSVAKTADGHGITFTFNQGDPVTITLDDETGSGDVVKVVDGILYINDEPQELKVATSETKPSIIMQDGVWAVLQEDGTYKSTGVPVSGVSVAGSEADGFTLTIFDKDGNKQEVKVPTATSIVSDLILIDNKQNLDFKKFTYTGEVVIKEWKGPRTLPAEKGKQINLVSSVETPVVQINPTGVDGKELTYSLVDSKNNIPNHIALKATDYKELVVERTANPNGLYTLSMNEAFISMDDVEKFINQFKDGDNYKLYAVTIGNIRSEYQLKVQESQEKINLTQLEIKDASGNLIEINGQKFVGINQTCGSSKHLAAKINTNEWYFVNGKNAGALYDMHLSVDDDAKTLFGIEIEETVGTYKFRLTKTPDNITKAGFKLTLETVSNEGAHETANVWFGQASTISNEVVYDPITHQLSKNSTTDLSKDKNFFQIDLTKMKDALGTEGLALWNTKVKRHEVTYLKADGTPLTETDQIVETFVSELKDNMKGNNDKAVRVGKTAKNMIFAVNNKKAGNKKTSPFRIGEQYTAVITFYDALTGGEKLNSIKVPFTFTLPAITELFAIDPGFVQDNVANCYLYEDDSDKYIAGTTTSTTATFKLSRIFSKYDTNGFTVKLNTTDKIGSTDKVSSQLADLNVAGYDEVPVEPNQLAYLALTGTLGQEPGYDQVLKLTIDGKFDNAWTYPSDTVFNFQVKVMSPIEKGKIVPKEGNVVTIKASDLDGYKFGNDVIIGYTYNTEVSYKVMPDIINEKDNSKAAWSRTDIKEVTGETGNKLYFEVGNGGLATAATTKTIDGKEVTVEGGLILKGYQVDHTVETTIKIKVEDIWGRVKSSPVPVKITVGE